MGGNVRALAVLVVAAPLACSLVLPGEAELTGGARDTPDGEPPACAPAELSCSGACVDVQTSASHCGRCGAACGPEEICRAARCAKPRFLSPSGSDANPGSSSLPWRTFEFAIPKLKPGDILVLKDGTYERSGTGTPSVRCGDNAAQGTDAQPIHVVAENERRAHVVSDGKEPALLVQGCASWRFEGLYISSADVRDPPQRKLVDISRARAIVLRRLLVDRSNRYATPHVMVALTDVSDSLVEESEIYRFHNDGIRLSGSYNVLRRNYVNPAGHPKLPDAPDHAEQGIYADTGTNDVFENNVVERSETGLIAGGSLQFKYFGNITMDARWGLYLLAWGNTAESMPRETLVENNLFLRSGISFYAGSSKNTRVRACTAMMGATLGFAVDGAAPGKGDGAWSFLAENTLAWKNASQGFTIAIADFRVTHSNAFEQTVNFYADDKTRFESTRSDDPKLGSCTVMVPDGSPMKRGGKDGADIGANVIYRTEDGVLTNVPLWRPTEGYRFQGCGAVVSGVNDVPETSCSGVSKRLAVGAADGCPLPY